MRRVWGRVLPVASLVLALACSRFDLDLGNQPPPGNAPREARPQLWTMFDIHKAQLENRPVARTASFPDGFRADTFIVPQPDGTSTLRVIPAFSEGEPAAYVLPEIWLNFDEIWVQPWYSLITAWNDKSNAQNALMSPEGEEAPPIWDVSHRSLFYSPFWIEYYVVVKPGTAWDHYTSVEQIVNDGLAIYRGPPWIYSVRPEGVTLGPKPVHPYMQKEVATFLREYPVSWVDNEPVPYFDEGFNNFKYDPATQVVEEVPLFMLVKRDAAGKTVFLDAPHIIGTGPLLSKRPPELYNGRPRFGSYTRFHLATVPATADVFNPEVHLMAAEKLVAMGLDPQAWRGKVARNAIKIVETGRACFEEATFPMGCTWLDSQAKIEDAGGIASIRRTEVTACSPVVFYAGKGIGR